MKKEQNAEKTKVRKLARTKEKVSQWTTNPLNEKVLDYHNYEMTKSESVLYFVAAFLVGGVVSQFFYGGLFQEDGVPTLLTYISNSAAFVIVGLLVGKVFLPVRSRQLAEKRRDTLRRQFRDMLESLTASLAANSTVRDAFSSAYTDMCMQYSDDALISKELDQFRRAEQINVTLDVMMDDFAKRSGVEEIWAFGFLMYQNWAVQYVATDTASRIAQTYGYSSSDPITGYISHATRVSLSPYRYKDDEEEKIQDVNANRAEKYARYSLKKAGFAKEKGLDIEVTTVKDALAASHVEVKVTAQYEIPFGFAMKYFGQSPYREFTATGRAVCLDIQHYIYTNKSLDAMEDAIGAGVSSSVIKTAEKVISIIRSGFKALKK